MKVGTIQTTRMWILAVVVLLSSWGVGRAAVLINELAPGVNGVNTAEFIELYNTGTSSVDLTGWSLALRNKSATSDNGVFPLSGTIPAEGYFLITSPDYDAQRGAFTPPLPAGDLVDTLKLVVGAMSADNGQIGLKDSGGAVVDAIGYYVSEPFPSPYYVETAPLFLGGSFSSRSSLSRDVNHTDTNNNTVDFTKVTTITPMNSTGIIEPTPTPGPSPTPAPTPSGGPFPYLTFKNDPTNSMVVSWFNSAATGDSSVDYGATSSYGSTATNAAVGNIHHVELTGLTAGATYHYRIRSSDGTTGTDNTFTLPPANLTDFTFAAFGDTRGLDPGQDSSAIHIRHKAECDHIASKAPLFALHTGDMVNQGSLVDDWNYYFYDEQNLTRALPLVPAMGNHEVQPGGQPYYYYFDLFSPVIPTNGLSGSNGRVYSFDYGNCHFVVLSSYQIDMTQQRDWLAADLAAAAARPNIRWIFAAMHDPLYTSANSHPGNTTERSLWGPLFDQYHVAMVFAGHNHLYERTHPIYNQTMPGYGTVYITAGAGGGPFNTEDPSTPDYPYMAAWYQGNTCAAFVHVTNSSVSLQAINPSNAVVDSVTVTAASRVETWYLY